MQNLPNTEKIITKDVKQNLNIWNFGFQLETRLEFHQLETRYM